jgi:hypothetical protein
MLVVTSKMREKKPNCGDLGHQVPDWPLNRSQKNAPKEGAGNGTLLEALIMCNYRARSYLKNERKKTKLGLRWPKGPDWLLNRTQKNAPKGGAVNGTLLEALIMCNHRARSYLKNEKEKTKLRLRWTTRA